MKKFILFILLGLANPGFAWAAAATATFTPTFTRTFTATKTPTNTFTFTNTATHTPTHTFTNTATHTFTLTFTPTHTPTHTHTFTATHTNTHTFTPTPTAIAIYYGRSYIEGTTAVTITAAGFNPDTDCVTVSINDPTGASTVFYNIQDSTALGDDKIVIDQTGASTVQFSYSWTRCRYTPVPTPGS